MSTILDRRGVLRSRLSVKVKRGKLYIVLMIDGSSSMQGCPIAQLNKGGRDVEAVLKQVQAENPSVAIQIRVLVFNSDAAWQSSGWIEAAKFRWVDVTAGGSTNLGNALTEVSTVLDGEMLGGTRLPPHIVLLTDAAPTDDWESPLDALIRQQPYGASSVRSGIACGQADFEMLKLFIGESGGILAEADSVDKLRAVFKALLESVSRVGSQAPGAARTLQEEFDEQLDDDNDSQDEDNNGVATLY